MRTPNELILRLGKSLRFAVVSADRGDSYEPPLETRWTLRAFDEWENQRRIQAEAILNDILGDE